MPARERLHGIAIALSANAFIALVLQFGDAVQRTFWLIGLVLMFATYAVLLLAYPNWRWAALSALGIGTALIGALSLFVALASGTGNSQDLDRGAYILAGLGWLASGGLVAFFGHRNRNAPVAAAAATPQAAPSPSSPTLPPAAPPATGP